jgi:hypothetical protein
MATGIEVRAVPGDQRPWLESFGTIDCGYELMRVAWPKLQHQFAVRRKGESVDTDVADPPEKTVIGHHRYPAKLLNQTPVDLLVIERGFLKHPTAGYIREPWEDLIHTTNQQARPKVILESWPSSAEFWSKGPVCKASLTRWADVGYTSRCKLINATRVGGAIAQSRLMVARIQKDSAPHWRWPCEEAAATMARPMSNLLTPPGLVRTHHQSGPITKAVLWWEFPREHWVGLREGSRMNFLKPPEPRLNANANMDEEQLQVAAAFVDELIDLGVVDTLEDGQAILLNAPLFVVPKEGQEGEWRVIADMLRGGQNMCIGNDPVVLPRMSHILEQLYEGRFVGRC